MSATDTNEDISTTTAELSNEWGLPERRIELAATSLSNVAICMGFVETDELGLIDLRQQVHDQVAA